MVAMNNQIRPARTAVNHPFFIFTDSLLCEVASSPKSPNPVDSLGAVGTMAIDAVEACAGKVGGVVDTVMNCDLHVKYIRGAETNGRMIESATCVPFNALVNPSFPTAPAIMILGMIAIALVTNLLIHGVTFQLSAPSETI